MGTIKELPKLDRPREKAIRYGISSLSDIELLTLLISSGYKGSSALEISTFLISSFKGLNSLSKATLNELKKIKGIKEAKAIIIVALFELHNRLNIKTNEERIEIASEEYLYNKYKTQLLDSQQENLILIILNSKKEIIHEKTLYVGTEKNMCYSYKDVWRELYIHSGKYFYLIHNHPNSSCAPSREDSAFTSELFLESRRVKIPMIDHLIIGKDGYHSFQKLKKAKK